MNKGLYIGAAVITAFIFFTGFFLGLVIENERVDYMDDLYREHTISFTSSQLQFEYLSEAINEDTCNAVFSSYSRSLDELGKAQEKLETYSEDEKINEEQFDLLKRDYLLTQLKFWFLAKQLKNACPDLDVASLLYFHGPAKYCSDCDSQSFVLDYLKKRYKQDVLIFSFDAIESNEPMVEILKTTYNITELPTIIVQDEVLYGKQSSQAIEGVLCKYYNSNELCPFSEDDLE